jgi:lipid-A-disaccharide synthase-like uncharacterized protein
MIDQWSAVLYYPLGLLPNVFFFLRFFIQWIKSEKRKQSIVDETFWQLSLIGNVLLALHYFIQLQYLFLVIQMTLGGVAWRNLCVIKNPSHALSLKFILSFLMVITTVSCGFFFRQSVFFNHFDLLTAPLGKTMSPETISLPWKILGLVGGCLFASRFWIQWWKAETQRRSTLDQTFWLLSLVGSGLSLFYFAAIRDFVSVINYSVGLIPYVRNLILLRQASNVSIR